MSDKKDDKSKRDQLFTIIHDNVSPLQIAEPDQFEAAILEFLKQVGMCIEVNRATIWENFTDNEGRFCCRQLYEWVQNAVVTTGWDITNCTYYDDIPDLRDAMMQKKIINEPLRNWPVEIQRYLDGQGILSYLIIPIFIRGQFWGWMDFEDCEKERYFADAEVSVLRFTGLLLGSLILKTITSTDLIREKEDALKLKQEHLDTVAKISKLTYWEWDVPNDRLTFSYHLKDEFGYDPGEICRVDFNDMAVHETPSTWFDIIHSDDRAHVMEELNWYINGTINHYRSELRIRHKNGKYIWAITSGHITKWKDGKPVLIIGGLINISDIKTAESSNLAKSQFLATMSHEIRTPLNAILGLSEVELQKEFPKESRFDETRSNLEKIYNSGNILLRIINDILDISKIETGKLNLIPLDYSFSSLINDTVHLNLVRIGSKSIDFELNIDETIPGKLYGDELRVKQILNNLLSNAIKYTEAGRVTLDIRGEINGGNVSITFKVRDTGQGIKKEDMGKLFTQYTQLNARINLSIEGTGLGLSITKNLVKMMGGVIEVESEYGKGSIFTVTIPQKIIDAEPLGEEVVSSLKNFRFIDKRYRRTQPRYRIPTGKVLLVDDVQTNLDVAAGLMRPYGLTIEGVKSGREAIEKVAAAENSAKEERYDIIFMDHMMPELDGISASKIIRERESEYAKKVPIVALSANALVGNKEMFLQNGIDDFLPKPIEIKRLDDILLKWIPSEKHVKTLGAAKSAEAETDTIPKINGLDTALGLIQTGLSVKAYKHILSVFRKDSEERITQIGRAFAAGNIKDYTLFAHAIKSVSLSLGALEVGNLAAKLEIAGNAGDELLIQDKTEEFLAMLRTLNKNIDEALCQDSVGNGEKKESVGFSAMNLEDLRKALCDMNIRELNKMLIEYKEMPLDNKARELANEIESDVLVFEYEKAVERIDNLK